MSSVKVRKQSVKKGVAEMKVEVKQEAMRKGRGGSYPTSGRSAECWLRKTAEPDLSTDAAGPTGASISV